ncbi:MAG: oligosaccharide flippase family protein [Ruminococcus sp.]|nr:oligosaccharide flippase family protein [Ruminococcus sp.]
MSKFKLFVENFLVYGFGGIISKVIPLIMVPVITRLMPDTGYYGISDLSFTLVNFGSAFAVMGMFDAMYRMFFEKEDDDYKKVVCSTTMTFTLVTSVIVFLIMVILKEPIADWFFDDPKYAYIVYLTALGTLVTGTNSIISAPTRMQNKRKVYLVTNTLSPLIAYAVAIPLLLMGCYTIAMPLAAVISGVVLEIAFGVMNRSWFSLKLFDKTILRQLLAIGIPLFPNFLIYWLFNSCDRIMITNMIDLGAAGVYSAGSKLGHISQLIYIAFAGGWQFFAFSTMKEKDQVKQNSQVFEYLGVISFAATFFMCAVSSTLFRAVFTEEYYPAYIIAPYLFIAPLLQMLFQVIANQFIVVKKTWPNMVILLCGAVINVIVNFLLIPVLGIEGAALATLLGYAVSDVICVIVLCRMKLMVVTKRFLLCTALAAGFFAAWRLLFDSQLLIGLAAALAVSGIFVLLYRPELRWLLSKLRRVKTSTEDGGNL